MHRTVTPLITVVLLLVALGMLVLMSASSERSSDASYFVERQLIWLGISVVAAVVTARLDYRLYERAVLPLALVSIGLLVLVRIPGIGKMVNGSWRWLQVGPMTIQPSEFAKPVFIIVMSWWLARSMRRLEEIRYGLVIPFLLLASFAVPILVEPDYGTTLLVAAVGLCLMMMAGTPMLPLMGVAGVGLLGVAMLIFQNPERMGRIMAFLDPQAHEQGKAWQLANSLRAFASGELFGVGFGNSFQKYHYLPEAHTDFIFPIIGEELGLIASLLVVVMYGVLFATGMQVARRAQDLFGRFLAHGIALMIALQALINFAVVTGSAPTKGLALPFISYGGSSILASSIMFGILLNIAIDGERGRLRKNKGLFKDRSRQAS
ncbi:MAG: putative lipid II flippase FtsW [Kiritimatiellaceae bacterium]|nr:MAG: putative lipid II flippase FtsW [Kiritimatiellaceae bacterium]|tara:strand:+ start:1499 stop:2629 length:1131 start_codon:yes stop_codon:yes gene_type:complete